MLNDFALKLRLALVRFSAMLEYLVYTPLVKNFYFALSIKSLCEVPWSDYDSV